MKIKILVVPSLIVIIISLLIWIIIPEYDVLKVAKDDLAAQKAKVLDIQKKNELIKSLSDELQKDSKSRTVIMNYVPAGRQENEAIDNMNFLASSSGVALSNVEIIQNKEAAQQSTDPLMTFGADGLPISPSSVSEAKTFVVKVELAGSYEGLRSFLEKMMLLQRHNNVKAMSISADKGVQSGEASAAPTGIVMASIDLVFDYLEKKYSAINLDSSLFSEGQLDIAVAESIEKDATTTLLKLNERAGGKTNIFRP